MLSSPGRRSKVWEALDRNIGKPGQNRGQIVAHWDVDASAGFDDREDGGDFGSGLLTSDVDPVFATERHRTHGVFGEVVARCNRVHR